MSEKELWISVFTQITHAILYTINCSSPPVEYIHFKCFYAKKVCRIDSRGAKAIKKLLMA